MRSDSLKYPYVLFDLGGTLIYTDGDFTENLLRAIQAATRTLRASGFDLDQQAFSDAYYDTIQHYYRKREECCIEYPSDFVLREALKAFGYPDVDPHIIHRTLLSLYTITQTAWHIEADAVSMLQALRASGRRLGIVSNAAFDEDVQMLVDQAAIRPYFDFILTSAAVGIRKPNPIIFNQALGYWNATPQQAAMVGDTLSADISGANDIGIASIWIKRRADPDETQNLFSTFPPLATVDTLAEIPAVLNAL